MSRTKHAADLCVLLVRETYGELTCRIFALLARRGRQTIQGIIHHTRLSAREVRHGLAVLLQQNLVYFHTDDSHITYYEANQDTAYYILRSGRVMDMTRARYGTLAREVVQNLLLLGHTKVADLIGAYKARETADGGISNGAKSERNQNGSNGHTEQHASLQIDAVLAELLEAGFIQPVVKSMFRSPTDTYSLVEKEIINENFRGGVKGVIQKQQLQKMVRDALKEVRSESEGWQNKNPGKRPSNGSQVNGGGKRRKLSNGVNGSLSHHDDVPQVNRDLIVRINYEKFTVSFRNRQLVKIAAHDIGDVTSQVYGEVLRSMETSISRCRPDPIIDAIEDTDKHNSEDLTRTERAAHPTITTLVLTDQLNPSIKTNLGIGRIPDKRTDSKSLDEAQKKRKRFGDMDAEGNHSNDPSEFINAMDIDRDSPDPFVESPAVQPIRTPKVTFQDRPQRPQIAEEQLSKPQQVQSHLALLAEHSNHLLERVGGAGLGEWTVDFERAIIYLREVELDAYILQRFGRQGRRISQILRQNGKLDEKQITKFGLIKQKDARTKLVELQMAGFVDIQEVPKDNNRTPSRTLFLWFFDTERVTAIFLDILYKTMCRCLQALEVEKYEYREILALADRSDVRGHESETLSPHQASLLEEYRMKENRLLTQIFRLDRLVGIFRDF